MKGTQPKQVDAALSELNVTPDNIDNVDSGEQLLNKGIGDQGRRAERDSLRPRLIKARRQLLAANTLVVALNSGRLLALTLGSGLFIELASPQFGQQAGFSIVRLKRRKAASNGSFFFSRTIGILSVSYKSMSVVSFRRKPKWWRMIKNPKLASDLSLLG